MMLNFFPAIAEIWLAVSAFIVLLGGLYSKTNNWKGWSRVAVIAILFAMIVAVRRYNGSVSIFDGVFVQDNLAIIFKCLIALGSIAAIFLSVPYFDKRGEGKFEYPLLIMLATVGMFGMVSSQDFLSLYVSLELQSLSLYILASFRRDNRLNSEAGLKYFFLGALSSGVLLYGISLMYGFCGSTSYLAIANTFSQQSEMMPGIIVGLVMVIAGLAFKVSAVPFHMWTPDVYQGAPTPVTAFFAMAPKAAAIGVLTRLMLTVFAPVLDQVQQIFVILAFGSMAVGAFAAIAQKNIKRLMAYSSIGHVGFIVLALAAGGPLGAKAAILYTILYVLMSAGSFAVILAVYDDEEGAEDIDKIAGLAKSHPVLAASFAALLLSMAGIPPLAGFFAKLWVFKSALEADLIWIVVAGVLFSVVSAFYYLRIIKLMYFDAAPSKAPVVNTSKIWTWIAALSALSMIVLLIIPQPLANLVTWATGVY